MAAQPPVERAVGLGDLLCALQELKATVEQAAPVVGIDAGEVVLGCALDDDGQQIGTVVAKFEQLDQDGGVAKAPVKWMFPFATSSDVVEGYTGAHGPCSSNVESDPLNWCVDGLEYTEWVLKREGVPLGQSHWTNHQGQAVTNPLSTAASYAKGSCAVTNGGAIDIPLCTP